MNFQVSLNFTDSDINQKPRSTAQIDEDPYSIMDREGPGAHDFSPLSRSAEQIELKQLVQENHVAPRREIQNVRQQLQREKPFPSTYVSLGENMSSLKAAPMDNFSDALDKRLTN
jgi:hypothetical protein